MPQPARRLTGYYGLVGGLLVAATALGLGLSRLGGPWAIFSFDPTVYLGLAAALVAYGWWAADVPLARRLYFGTGLLTVWLALETPLDGVGDHYLQSIHMVQHMLLIAFAPPFLLLGLTPPLARSLRALPTVGWLTEPVPALLVYSAAIVVWHLPPLFDLAVSSEPVHVLEHLFFLGAGLIFWWPALEATGETCRQHLAPGWKIVYLFLGTFPMMGVALPLQFSRSVFYAGYAAAPRLVQPITPIIDQTVAGAVMMMMDMIVITIDMVVVFGRWVQSEMATDSQVGAAGGS